MALPDTLKNWQLSSYTNNTWTDLVAESGIVNSIIVANDGGSAVSVEIRREQSASSLAIIVPATTIAPNETYVFEKPLNITGTQAIQIRCDIAGAEFDANGVI